MLASTEVIDKIESRFHKILIHVFNQFSKYHTNKAISFRYKVRAKDIFRLIFWNESLHKVTNRVIIS
jgi:hypothetical protein